MIVLMFGFFLIVIGSMANIVLSGFGIIMQLAGVTILAVGLPISILKTKPNPLLFPSCVAGFLMVAAGLAIIFQGSWFSNPFDGNPFLATWLTLLGLVYIVAGAPIMYLVSRRKFKSTQNVEGIPLFDESYIQPPQFPRGWGSETVIEREVIEREVLLTRRIPPTCHKCGADVNPEEVDWIGPNTVRCPHCGASLVVKIERL